MSTSVLTENPGDGVFTITLNRPEKRNALNIALLEQLCEAVDAANGDASVRAIVLKGAGPAFCAGLDLKEAGDTANSHRSADLIARMLSSVYYSSKVTIAAVHGAALAGGAGLMSCCDLVIAAADTQIGYPEVRRGMVAGLVMTFLRRQLHERHARELLLTGDIIDADRAMEIGLVNRCVPSDFLDTAVEQAVEKILKGAPGAIARSKRLFDELWHHSAQGDFERALELHVEVRNAHEAQEGMRAFLEKRPPSWDR
jgi:methylglutaconyl-CoA hydratase